MKLTNIVSVSVTNFKCFEGRKQYGPFSRLTAINGATGSGKTILLEGLAFALGAEPEDLGVENLRGLINERGNHCEVEVVIDHKGEERTFVRKIVQDEDEDGNKLPHACEWFINERSVTQKEYGAVLDEMNLRQGEMCHIVQLDRNRIRLEDPEELGDYFVKVFDLEEDRDEFDDISLKLKKAEKTKEKLDAISKVLEEENKLTIRFVLLKMYRAVYICGNCQAKTAAKRAEIQDLEQQLVAAARRNYFRERASMVARGREVLSLKKYKLQCFKNSEAHWMSKFRAAHDEAKLDKLELPTRRVIQNGKLFYEVVYDSLPQDRISHASQLEPFLKETTQQLNALRKEWMKLNNVRRPDWKYVRILGRKKAHEAKVKKNEEDLAAIKAEYERIKEKYTQKYESKMNELQTAMTHTYRRVYDDDCRNVKLSFFEDDISKGIEGSIDTVDYNDHEFMILSGGEKKLLELTLHCAVVQLTSTPYLFLDSFDNHFHAKTFKHLVPFLKLAADRLCQVVVVCRNSVLYNQIESRVTV
ncbi:unnamed protein product [Caenorhabditis brenneri]